jgi:hypothetical protein
MIRNFLLLSVGLVAAACGGGDPDPDREPTVGAEIASDYNRQMDEARELEQQLELKKRELDAAIDASENG